MKNQKHTIRKIVSFLNNTEEDGGFWLPNIQRPFIWSEDQICRLFDSILRQYPISTLLIWKTKSQMRHRRFIDNWKDTLQLSDFYVPENNSKKCLVLDGQQRLQSLFIGLRGGYSGKELYFNILSGEVSNPDDVKYQFKFLSSKEVTFPWVNFKNLVHSDEKFRIIEDRITSKAGRAISSEEAGKIKDNIELVSRTLTKDDAITYQELDSIEYPSLYKEDDVVEIFIRANSGGTKLGKSDLLFSLLSANWGMADENMEELLKKLNAHGFAFDRDFVLKTCLVILGEGARYEVSKFRKEGVRELIENNWDKISGAIVDVLDWVRGKTFIQCNKALPSYLVLIPLIFFRYHYCSNLNMEKNIDTYLLRCLMAGAFSGQPDSLIDAFVKKIQEIKVFDTEELFNVVRSQGRSLELTKDRLWQMGYGSGTIHLLFNIWYKDFNHTPSYENNLPQIDHIFPQSLLREQKILNVDSGRMVKKYTTSECNQLANCMLLTREENGSGNKSDKLPSIWFDDKSADYLQRHLIPSDPKLWQTENYEEFIAERKKLLFEHFANLKIVSVI